MIRTLLSITCIFLIVCACSKRSDKPKILVFTKTSGYKHESIITGIVAIRNLGVENGFDVDTTSQSDTFNEETLKQYAAVVFLSTTGDVLDHYQEADFERYIQAGGGYVGIHAASDCEYDWGWYGRLTGGYFWDHPGMNDTLPNIQHGTLSIIDKNNEATEFLPEKWERTDEWYSFKKLSDQVNVLISIDESSYKGGKRMRHHPMSWYHAYDGGRAFYTAFGHTNESFTESLFLKHLLAGIQYAIGGNSKPDYSKAITQRIPEEDRLKRTILATGDFFEPLEMTILPNLDILIAQRRGEILLYKNGDSVTRQAGFVSAYYKTNTAGANAEEGVLGIKADPDFARNHFVYVFYSPADTSVNRLSRFKFENDTFDIQSEKVILQFYSQREICCHTGGSIAFDKDGLLYLSTGDNTTPFNEDNQKYVSHGYAPLDDRKGHEKYDARRTSGNTNDLRGKILRIRVREDGSYEIPEGNLYSKFQSGTRPEIYVQGNRNPYRISIDQRNGFLYWGEVGPDANHDSLEVRGPRGYDEINQARQAGFFGWPLFVGNNFAYHEYNYGTGESGSAFDAEAPLNKSRNNTGIEELPPAQPAFIWYPYGDSPDFPQVKSGGRNAMAGPVYYTSMFPEATRLPAYYNGKLFIYDWIRGWVKVVTMQTDGDYDKMEPFMESTKFNSLVDMEVGPDGRLYLLEYGNGWYSKNADAALSRIDFNAGNRAPKVETLQVDKTSGTLPFKVLVTTKANDPDNDQLTYIWHLGDSIQKETAEPRLEYVFNKVGEYTLYVDVRDDKKQSVRSNSVSVYAGNEAPLVSIDIIGNKSFYFPDKQVEYAIRITDGDRFIVKDLSSLSVSADYLIGSDKAAVSPGHQVMTDVIAGKNLMESLDCKSCHKLTEKSIGPAYKDVADRYSKDQQAMNKLSRKIINGGAGVWGKEVMPAHLDLKEHDARKLVSWILSLDERGQVKHSLPAQGKVNATLGKPPVDNGVFVLSASYTDQGGQNVKPLTGYGSHTLSNSSMNFSQARNTRHCTIDKGNLHFKALSSIGSFSFDSIDLTDVTVVEIEASIPVSSQGISFEIHLDSPEGIKISEVLPGETGRNVKVNTVGGKVRLIFKIKNINDGKLHNMYIVHKPGSGSEGAATFHTIQFKPS